MNFFQIEKFNKSSIGKDFQLPMNNYEESPIVNQHFVFLAFSTRIWNGQNCSGKASLEG